MNDLLELGVGGCNLAQVAVTVRHGHFERPGCIALGAEHGVPLAVLAEVVVDEVASYVDIEVVLLGVLLLAHLEVLEVDVFLVLLHGEVLLEVGRVFLVYGAQVALHFA